MNPNTVYKTALTLTSSFFVLVSFPCFAQHKLYRDTTIDHLPFGIYTKFEVDINKCFIYEYPNFKSAIKSYLTMGDRIKPLKTVGEFYYIEFKTIKGIASKGWVARRNVLTVDSVTRVN